MTFPDMDWSEACDQVAISCTEITKEFTKFELEYGHILNNNEMDLVKEIIGESEALQWEIDHENAEVSATGTKMAEAILEKIETLRKSMRDRFLGMVTA